MRIPMAEKYCEYCDNGNDDSIPFVLADDVYAEVHFAKFCPFCGRKLGDGDDD